MKQISILADEERVSLNDLYNGKISFEIKCYILCPLLLNSRSEARI